MIKLFSPGLALFFFFCLFLSLGEVGGIWLWLGECTWSPMRLCNIFTNPPPSLAVNFLQLLPSSLLYSVSDAWPPPLTFPLKIMWSPFKSFDPAPQVKSKDWSLTDTGQLQHDMWRLSSILRKRIVHSLIDFHWNAKIVFKVQVLISR